MTKPRHRSERLPVVITPFGEMVLICLAIFGFILLMGLVGGIESGWGT